MKKCKGCGVELQTTDKNRLGYTPKKDSEYCQRCFRLTHYNDVMINMQQGINNAEVLNKINKLDALVLWVVDLFDFEGCMIDGINRHLANKDIILVLTKRDLLPLTTGDQKIIQFATKRLKSYGINVLGGIIVGGLNKKVDNNVNDSILLINDVIDQFRNNRDVVVMGVANSGKSTLLNALLNDNKLTVSNHPGTSLDLNPIEMDDYTLYDTPGLVKEKSLLTKVDSNQLSTIIPKKRIKPIQYQLRKNQSIAVGGLARIDLIGCENTSVTCYFSNELNLHRGKSENADDLWENHLNELLVPTTTDKFDNFKKYSTTKKEDKMDVVISGLGWFSISGKVKEIIVYVDEDVDVIFRGALI